jgi:ribosome-associated heat shock protein Hsp15
MSEAESIRLDKWLWHARFAKSRALAARLCQSGHLRLSGEIVAKPHRLVRVGDVLTFPAGGHIRTVRIAALGERRGPAVEARQLYEDLAPPSPESALPRREPAWK